MSKDRSNLIKKITDPLTIITSLSFINYLVLFIIYLVLPIYRARSTEENRYTLQYWTGYFETYLTDGVTLVESGQNNDFLIGPSITIFIGILLMLIATIVQLLLIFLLKNIERKKFLMKSIMPYFISNSLILIGVFTFMKWTIDVADEYFTVTALVPIKYSIFISILFIIITMGFAVFYSQLKPEKQITI